MKLLPCLAALALALPAAAQDHRELGAHQHGHGRMGIAFEGSRIAIELRAPGADIVGFEHAAVTPEDRAALDAAVAALARPLELFVLPAGAGCSVTSASAGLVDEDHEHAEEPEEHAEAEGHDGHDEHHSEFQAGYLLTCADAAAVTRIDFAYFATFPNALELEVQLVTDKGAREFDVGRGAPVLDLAGSM